MFDAFKRFLAGAQARTAPQVGEPSAPGAAMPALHMQVDGPAAMRGIEDRGEQVDDQTNPAVVPSSARAWRGPAITGVPVDASGDIGLSTERATAANAHLSPGHPDWRRVGVAAQGNPAAPEAPWEPVYGVEHVNERIAVFQDGHQAPSVTRAGWTGENSPKRPAGFQIATLLRPFDQLAAQHPGVVAKVGQPNPTASRPPLRHQLLGGRPNPAGTTGSGTPGAATGPMKNTIRVVPGAWDADLVTSTQTPASAMSARTKGWRLA